MLQCPAGGVYFFGRYLLWKDVLHQHYHRTSHMVVTAPEGPATA